MLFFNKNISSSRRNTAFTLAEVLIVIGIIGMIADMTIPTLVQGVSVQQYKVAYKKAYSDISNATLGEIFAGTFPSRGAGWDAAAAEAEYQLLKNAFKVIKECLPGSLNECWAVGENLTPGSASQPTNNEKSFIDASGRTWAEYSNQENLYLVDTNGIKTPNRFGKDRWMFTFCDSSNTRVNTGIPAKVCLYVVQDETAPSWICHYPPCNYYSWLFD